MSVSVGVDAGRQVEAAVQAAGLVVVDAEGGTDSSGGATVRFQIARPERREAKQMLEVSAGLDPSRTPALETQMREYLKEAAVRLRSPRPEVYLTLSGLPLGFRGFKWPFHSSTSGADTDLVHGEIHLEDGEASGLHAKIAASMTVTFREVVAAPEQPYAEGFIYNAVRKTIDQGQLELVKSGNRQPVPVTTRYYSSKQGKFVFNDTTETQRSEFLLGKVFWLSGVLGERAPVWLLDPRDAQYLNTTTTALGETARSLAGEGLLHLASDVEFATPTEALMGHRAQYKAELAETLSFIKPTFNEEMRGGHTNM